MGRQGKFGGRNMGYYEDFEDVGEYYAYIDQLERDFIDEEYDDEDFDDDEYDF